MRRCPLSKKSKPLMAFAEDGWIPSASAQSRTTWIFSLTRYCPRTGYMQMLESQVPESQPRIENVRELKSNIMAYVDAAEEPRPFRDSWRKWRSTPTWTATMSRTTVS